MSEESLSSLQIVIHIPRVSVSEETPSIIIVYRVIHDIPRVSVSEETPSI